jgi:hypothetical protein
MMIKIDKFDGGLAELQQFAKREMVLEVTGASPPGRVKVGDQVFENAGKFHEWAAALDVAGFNQLYDTWIEFLDRENASLE